MLRASIVRVAGISLVASALFLVAACSGSKTSRGSSTPSDGGAAPSPAASQAQQGAQLFARGCAGCHGAAGEGTAKAPALIGPGALPSNPPAGRRFRTGPFSTAKDIGMFIKDTMPPGSRTPPNETAALLTFLLESNGVTPGRAMDPSTAGSIPWRR